MFIMPSKHKSAVKKAVKAIAKAMPKTKAKAPKRKSGNKKGNIRGRGGYFSDLVSSVAAPFLDNSASQGVINSGARALGEGIGNTFLPGSGKYLGNAASWFSRILGHGSYTLPDFTVSQNSLMKTNQVPDFSGNPAKLNVIHREFLFDLYSSTTFQLQNLLLNPGNPQIPWLSQIASNFEEFQWNGLVIEFKTMSATAVGTTSSALGTVIMATDYDVLDSNFPNKRAMEITDFASSTAPCQSQIHPIECDTKENVMRKMYVQAGATNIASYPDDPRFSLPGNFQIATIGMQTAGINIGEVWISYDCTLTKPVIGQSLSLSSQKTAITGTSAGSSVPVVVSTTASPAQMFTVTASNGTGNGQAINVVQNAGFDGTWMLTLTVASVSNGGGAWTVPSLPGGQLIGTATRVNKVYPSNEVNSLDTYSMASTQTASSAPFAAEMVVWSTIITTAYSATNPCGIIIPYFSQATINNAATLIISPFQAALVSAPKPKINHVADQLELLTARLAKLESNSKDEVDTGDWQTCSEKDSHRFSDNLLGDNELFKRLRNTLKSADLSKGDPGDNEAMLSSVFPDVDDMGFVRVYNSTRYVNPSKFNRLGVPLQEEERSTTSSSSSDSVRFMSQDSVLLKTPHESRSSSRK
jgi:hypothetical protein